jgi:ABC-type cobalt transport system substrate-binding protein
MNLISRHEAKKQLKLPKSFLLHQNKYMNFTKKLVAIIILLSLIFYVGGKTQAYLFGMKSRDNSIQNIQSIEKTYKLDIPIVSFIFDPRGDHVESMMNKFNKELGEDKIYHISISPNMFSAKEVYE